MMSTLSMLPSHLTLSGFFNIFKILTFSTFATFIRFEHGIRSQAELNSAAKVQYESFGGFHHELEPAPRLLPHQKLPDCARDLMEEDDIENGQNKEDGDAMHFSRRCYVCKESYHRQHFFYDSMCSGCGDFNFFQRFESMQCEGLTAIVTGARIKIGYEIALKLLRCGCTVIITTRFPRYAAAKYGAESDFKVWQHRLSILGLDFCRLSSVTKFINHIKRKYQRIDMLINNAASTVRRTADFYGDIIEVERRALPQHIPKALVVEYEHFTDAMAVAPPLKSLESGTGPKMIEFVRSTSSSSSTFEDDESSGVMRKVLGSLGDYDENSQPYDLRKHNSWTAMLGQVPYSSHLWFWKMLEDFLAFLSLKWCEI